MEIHRPCFFRISSYGMDNHHKLQPFSSSWKLAMYSNPPRTRNTAESSVQRQKISVPQSNKASLLNLRLNRPQPSDHQYFIQGNRIEFGQFVVRETLGGEELWAVARLRAETEWDDRPNDRFGESSRKKLALQVFDMLKRRSKRCLHKCFCIVTVKKEDNYATDNVPKSVVGTVDLSIHYLLSGQTFPGEEVKDPVYDPVKTEQSRHGFIDDLCVAKSVRRQGIASKMLLFAIILAKSSGAKRLYLKVYSSNKPALELYHKMGFQVVDRATAQLTKERTCLLCLEW